MAVYTDIPSDTLEALLAEYSLGRLVSYTGIAEGVENSNYLVETDQGKYIATIYEKRVDADDLPFFIDLMDHLAGQGIPCPEPIPGKDGIVLREVEGKPFAMVSFLEGKWPKSIKNDHCREVGTMMARMHLASERFSQSRVNTMSLAAWQKMFKETEGRADEVASGMSDELSEGLAWLVAKWPEGLPEGVIHADLFPDNVFFQGEELTGLLDFYFACTDFFAYDLAIALNAWCFEHGTEFNITKAKAMLRGYNAVKPFTESELKALPVLASGAAMRFLLSRLYDWLNPVAGATVIPKDPMEYLKKLRFHRQVKSHKEYGL